MKDIESLLLVTLFHNCVLAIVAANNGYPFEPQKAMRNLQLLLFNLHPLVTSWATSCETLISSYIG